MITVFSVIRVCLAHIGNGEWDLARSGGSHNPSTWKLGVGGPKVHDHI